jgi:hypothetical protein
LVCCVHERLVEIEDEELSLSVEGHKISTFRGPTTFQPAVDCLTRQLSRGAVCSEMALAFCRDEAGERYLRSPVRRGPAWCNAGLGSTLVEVVE